MSLPVLTPSSITVNGATGTAVSTTIQGTNVSVFAVPGHSFGGTEASGFSFQGNGPDQANGSGSVSINAAATVEEGSYTFIVRATNGDGHVDASVTFVIGGNTNGNLAVNDATATVNVGQPFTFAPTASGPVAHWQIDDLPAGLTYSPTTGTISGTPTTAGVYLVSMAAQRSNGSGGWEIIATGVLHLTVVAVPPTDNSTTDSHIGIKIDLNTGAITVTNGAATAFYGDRKVLKMTFVPEVNAGNVSEVTCTLKERSEVRQYGTLLPVIPATSTDGTHFTTAAVAFEDERLFDSLTLYDEVEPQRLVTYALEVFFKWEGRLRKSYILDFPIQRPQDMDFAQANVIVPVSSPDGGEEAPTFDTEGNAGSSLPPASENEGKVCYRNKHFYGSDGTQWLPLDGSDMLRGENAAES